MSTFGRTYNKVAPLLIAGAMIFGAANVASAGWNDAGQNTFFTSPAETATTPPAKERYTYSDGTPVEDSQPMQSQPAPVSHPRAARAHYAQHTTQRTAEAKSHAPLVHHAMHPRGQENPHS